MGTLTRPPLGFEYILELLGQPSPVLSSVLKLPRPIQQVNFPSFFFMETRRHKY